MSDEVELAIQGDVAFVQLARPQRANALRLSMFEDLRRTILRLSDSPPAFVVLSGEGEHFCAGLDLGADGGFREAMQTMIDNQDAYRVQELVSKLKGILDAITRLPCVIVAAIEGQCHGAGLELALTADLRVASASATLGLPGVRDGLFTGLGGLAALSVLLGTTTASSLAMTGQCVDADRAYQMGLVQRTCEAGAARATALDLVAELQQLSPTARLQIQWAMRGIQGRLMEGLAEHEKQGAARTWIQGDWRSVS